MKTGFGHFDSSHRENICAAVLLLAMEVDDAVNGLVARLVRARLDVDPGSPLRGLGREARLAAAEDDSWARVDLCLLLEPPAGLA